MVGLNDVDNVALSNLISGKVGIIFGPADIQDTVDPEDAIRIAAGSGLPNMLAVGIGPDIIVTDLDGDPEALFELNRQGAVVIVHAHGDNIDRMMAVVPMLPGPVYGTTQVEETRGIHNYGGFTDGDRAVFLAMALGAKEVMLRGFDFNAPVEKARANPEVKRKKLDYARELIDFASAHYGIEVVHL